MPTNTYTYAFGGTPTGTHGKPGVTGIQGYGDRWQILFNGTWAANEKYGIVLTSAFDYSVGSINFFAASLTPNYCTTFKNRVYIGAGTQFNFSENGAPTEWEQQSPGAGFFSYLSYFGGQDLVYSISQLQGRLVVVGRRSVQLWTVDADPASFALVQEMDNIGSLSALATQNIGDFDVIILDDTGFRSLRTREVTLNAYVDDIGVAIDSLVQTDLTAVSAATCCAIVEPTTKNYWAYLNGKIYVLSRYPSSKVSAWTTFLPTYENYATVSADNATYDTNKQDTATVIIGTIYKWTPGAHEVSLVNGSQTLTAAGYFKATTTLVTFNGTASMATYTGLLQEVTLFTFVPQKFVILNGLVYVRGSFGEFLVYGGLAGTTYDGSIATVTLPWLDDKQPALMKLGQGIDIACEGNWIMSVSPDPATNNPVQVWQTPNPTGSELTDSSFDLLRVGYAQKGTHFLLSLTSDPTWGLPATISEILFHYNRADRK